MEAIQAEFAPRIDPLKVNIACVEKELIHLGLYGGLFAAGEGRINLHTGAVLRAVVERAKRVRGMLSRLEAAGMKET